MQIGKQIGKKLAELTVYDGDATTPGTVRHLKNLIAAGPQELKKVWTTQPLQFCIENSFSYVFEVDENQFAQLESQIRKSHLLLIEEKVFPSHPLLSLFHTPT